MSRWRYPFNVQIEGCNLYQVSHCVYVYTYLFGVKFRVDCESGLQMSLYDRRSSLYFIS